MANFMRKVYNTPKLRALKRKRSRVEAQLKAIGRKVKIAFKSESKRLARKNKKAAKRSKR